MNHQPNTPASLNEAVTLPTYGTLPWATVRAYVAAAVGSAPIIDPEYFIGHQTVGINFNSLNRIMSALAATGAAIDAREQEAAQVVTYHRDDEGQAAIEAYAAIAASLDAKNLKAVANWIAHGARATLGPGRVALTRRDWDSIKFFPLASREQERGGELGMVESHPNYVAGFKAGHAAGRKRATPSEALSPATVAQPVEWGDPKTVGMFVRQLQTIAPETPIHAAVHTDLDGKRVALTKPVTISRERVQGRRIRQGDQSVPYSIVVWASHDEAAQPWMEQEAKYEAQMRETHAALQADDTPLETGEGDAR